MQEVPAERGRPEEGSEATNRRKLLAKKQRKLDYVRAKASSPTAVNKACHMVILDLINAHWLPL